MGGVPGAGVLGGRREGGLTDERPRTDQVITAPMRGLKKSHGKGTDKSTRTHEHRDY